MQILTTKIQEIKKQIVDSHSPFLDQLTSIDEDFTRMAQFFERGIADPQMDSIYAELQNRLTKLEREIRYFGLSHGNPFYQRAINSLNGDYALDLEELQQSLEDFLIDLTMLELESDEAAILQKKRAIYEKHHDYRNRMFAKVFLTNNISQDNADALKAIITSSSIDSIDAQLLITAIMLSCMNIFESRKADLLYRVYKTCSQNENKDAKVLAQKALVAFVICTSVKDDSFDLSHYPIPPSLLSTIQQQFIKTVDSPRVGKVMEQDIMPDIIKNSEFDFINNKIVKKKTDRIDDILNPNKDEEAMEKMESAIKKMKDLQEAGNDLFFSGFKYVKNHPFFSTVTNWFCPFYFDHPQLPTFENADDKIVVEKILARSPFCEGDKYSFIFSMHKALGTIPAEIKNMLKNGEAELEIVGTTDFKHNAAYVRRIFMQDIFRFFKLCPWAKYMYNPLEPSTRSIICLHYLNIGNGEYDEIAIALCKTLRANGQTLEYNFLLHHWTPLTNEGKIFKAFCLINDQNAAKVAICLLDEVLATDKHNIQALFALTKACFVNKLYKPHFEVHKEEAVNALLALHFKNEADVSVLHNLVRAYLMIGNSDNAQKYAAMITDNQRTEKFIHTYLGLTLLSNGNIKSAMEKLKLSNPTLEDINDMADYVGISIPQSQLDMVVYLLHKKNEG